MLFKQVAEMASARNILWLNKTERLSKGKDELKSRQDAVIKASTAPRRPRRRLP